MKGTLRIFILLVMLLPGLASVASAQYMWLDTNGNGVSDAGDVMNANGTTTVHVWVNTLTNKDGSPAPFCDFTSENGLQINAYQLILHATTDGTVTFGTGTGGHGWVNVLPGASQLPGTVHSATDFWTSASGFDFNVAGTYELGNMTVAIAGGTTARLDPVATTPMGTIYGTAIGSFCTNPEGGNDWALGRHWFDVDGAPPGGPPPNAPPSITADATVNGAENTAVSDSHGPGITGSASDPDGDNVTLSQTNNAPFLTGPASAGPAPNPSITLTGTPNFTEAGTYTINWSAVDDASVPETATATTSVVIAPTDRPPAVTAPATASGDENTLITFGVTASDPDGEAIATLTAAPLPAGAVFTPVGTNTGTFSWTPDFNAAAGSPYSVTFTATNALSGSATTSITVNNVDRAPEVTAPASQSGQVGALLSFSVTATDPDGDAISSLTAAPLPAGATFTPNGTNTSGTFDWTPAVGQDGSHSVTFTASNALSGSATTNITIAPAADQAPVVTAPATQTGSEGVNLNFSVTATDPDADAIASLTAAPLPSGATFTPNGTNTSGVFDWTPGFDQAGPYSVTFTATNALSGSATTSITIENTDRAPEVTAPASQSGQVGVLLSFSVTATDPDGDAISSLTAAPLPAGATFTPNGTNTSGTFDWTPAVGQDGSHSVTFTASNALNGSATTNITIAAAADQPPVVTAPATQTGAEDVNLNFSVTATDPDADAIASLTAAPLPSGATFTPNGSNTSGVFDWTPDFNAAAGSPYSVTFTATNALSGSATTSITIENTDRAPEVTAPATFSGFEGSLFSFSVTAVDPDGDAISSFTAAPLPSGATFTPNGTNTSGTFEWTPGFDQAGPYSVTFTASNALSGSATTAITVENMDRAPEVTAPASQSGQVGVLLSFSVTAADPDGDAISSLTAAPLPSGATFTPNGTNTSGTFDWTPASGQDGSYSVTFTASNALSGSATTLITIAAPGDLAPVVTAPATQSGSEGVNLNFSVTATDPDADAIASLTAAPLPSGATFTPNGTNTSGVFDWTPGFDQAGPYNVTFTASNALSGSATTAITIENVDRPVTVDPIADVTVDEGASASAPVHANDPDGDLITLTASLPAFASLNPPTSGSGDVSTSVAINPGFSDAGSHPASVTATAGPTNATANFTIIVNPVDRAPVVTAPPTVSGSEGVLISFTVTATDPDGDAIASLTAAPLPTGATFTPNGTNTSGSFDWTPDLTQSGLHTVTFTASNALSGSATTLIDVGGANTPPVVTAPATEQVDEGAPLQIVVSATDGDGDAVSLSAAPLPTGATFSDHGNDTGTFDWTPGFDQAGIYTVTFTGDDGNGGIGTASTEITVNNVNRAPTADAGGPYFGVVNVPVPFDGTGSSDPDADPLTYVWNFGDGNSGGGATSPHTYVSPGTFMVTLTVSDGTLGDSDQTTAEIADVFPATAFLVGGNKTTRLGAGKPFTCVQIEPFQGSFDVSNVVLSTIKMVSPGTGSVGEIFASGKTAIDGDKNGNGTTEIAACFSKEDLRLLFGSLPTGPNSVNVTIEGSLATGGRFQAPLSMDVVVSGRALSAAASPNPFNPETSIDFVTERPGTVRLHIFDLTGRLVATLANHAMPAGYHSVRWDGRTQEGGKVASGIYYFRLEADGQSVKQRLTVLK